LGGAKMNRKLVKPVLFVIFSLSLTAIITGCLLSPKSQTNRNINKDKISAKESQSTLEQQAMKPMPVKLTSVKKISAKQKLYCKNTLKQ